MDWANRLTIGWATASYNTFHKMWEVTTEKNEIEVSYIWFSTKKTAEEFAFNRLATALDLNTIDMRQMLGLLRTKGRR